MDIEVFILAGGSGERFWPLSTPEVPKQFLKFFNGKSLLRLTFERFNERLSTEKIHVVTAEIYADMVAKELPELPRKNILTEPKKRNTAPACVLAALSMEEDGVMFISPADHYIPDSGKFWRSVEKAYEFVSKNPKALVTFGIVPTRPETGYGYIERGERVSEQIFKVKMFREKPSYEVAERYLESGNFYWNSGMFMWTKEGFMEDMKRWAPEIVQPFLECGEDIVCAYEKIEGISIDYALMEKSKNVFVVEASFEWSDVGNWNSLKELGYKGEVEPVIVDGENVYVIAKKPVVVVGVSDVVVVESEKGVLVVSQKDLEKIREGVRKVTGKK